MRATNFPGAPLTGLELIWALEDVGLHFRPSDTGKGCHDLEGLGDTYEGLHGDPGSAVFHLWTYASPEALEEEWFVSSYGTATPKTPDCLFGASAYRNENLILEVGFESRHEGYDGLRARIVGAFQGIDVRAR
jgi:hypothetical protein